MHASANRGFASGTPWLLLLGAGLLFPGVVSVAAALGSPQFAAPFVPFSVAHSPQSVAVGDLNGDAIPDLVTAGPDSVSVLLGNGDGTFGLRMDYAGGGPSVVLAYFDPGNTLDVATSGSVRMGNGDGSFADASSIPGVPLAAADLNDDTKVDLVLSEGSVLLGNGDGTFGPTMSYGASGLGVAIADFNADSRPDLTVASYPGFSVKVLLGNGDGTFAGATTYPTGSQAFSVAVGNLDGAGGLDICVGLDLSLQGSVGVMLGNGDGTFSEVTGFGQGYALDVVLGDFNADGKTDVAMAGGGAALLLGNGDGTLGPATACFAGPRPDAMAGTDMNVDGKPDLVCADFTLGAAYVLLGNGDGTFGPHSLYPVGTHPNWLAAVDLNHDSFPDLAVGNSILLGSGDGSFGSATTVALAPLAAVGDLNGDTHPDLVTFPLSGDRVGVLLGSGDATFGSQTTFASGSGPVSVAIGDLGGATGPDLVVATLDASNAGVAMVLPGDGSGTFGAGTPYSLGSDPAGVALADLDGDGDLDVAAARTGPFVAAPVGVFLGDGSGTLGARTDFGSGGSATTLAVGDLNSDDKQDLVLGSTSGLRVLLGNGNGTFGSQGTYADGTAFESVGIGDVDGDGKPDVVASTQNRNTVSVWAGIGDGTLGARTEYGTGRDPVWLAMSDVDGDTDLDVVTADHGSNTATVLLNLTAPTTAVLLSRFEAAWVGRGIEVRWQFGAGSGVVGTVLERSNAASGPWSEVNGLRRTEAGVEALTDDQVEPGREYFYRLVAALAGGAVVTFGPVSTTGNPPATGFGLDAVTPSLGEGPIRVSFAAPHEAQVRLAVHDVLGRVVELLVDGTVPEGRHVAVWEGSSAPAGLYFVRFEWPGGTATRRVILTR